MIRLICDVYCISMRVEWEGAMVKCEVRGARREVGIVRGSVRGIRARIRVISEAACEAVRYCALLRREG